MCECGELFKPQTLLSKDMIPKLHGEKKQKKTNQTKTLVYYKIGI